MAKKLRLSVAPIVGQLKELNRNAGVDLLHAHGLLPCGYALMLLDERTEHLVVVKFEIHRASAVIRPVGNCCMPEGTLRKLLLIAEPIPYGVCRDCGQRFDPDLSQSTGWRAQVTQQYDAHRKQGTCKREDASQVAARIAREATEQK